MIELLKRFYEGAKAFGDHLNPPPEAMSWADISGFITAGFTVLAVGVAAWALMQNSQSRNLAIVIDMTRQISEMRERMREEGLFNLAVPVEAHVLKFRAYQMLHLLEAASFLVNNGLATGKAKRFLNEWLTVEVQSMDANAFYGEHLADAKEGELTELRRVLDKVRAAQKKIEKA